MKKMRCYLIVSFIFALVIGCIVIWCYLEKKSTKNNFDKADLIIVLHQGPPTYQFVLSGGQILEASYGWREFDDLGFINSIDFMSEILIRKSTTIPDYMYNDIVELANNIIREESGTYAQGFGVWYLAILTPDTIYQVIYRFEESSVKEQELIAILEKHSPIEVNLGQPR